MQFEKVVVVDDDPVIRRMLVGHLQKQDIPVLGVTNVQQCLAEQEKDPGDLLLVDLHLPDGSGMDILQSVRKSDPGSDIVIMTGFGTIESAVEAMKMGAVNYLLKPFTLAQFDMALSQLQDQRRLRSENEYLREQLKGENFSTDFKFRSSEMKRVEDLIKRVAPTNATVLIQGESGTGKELISRAIFENSSRRDKPYIKVNCAAVPENLLESEFFGHEKGAFTGALSRREGRFELAHQGTLLLDEVTEISTNLQAKLLRVLQEQEFERLGGTRSIKVDVRIIATTNRDLEEAVEKGDFRRDLFFRLNVMPIKVPPMRERPGDLGFLLLYFLEKFAKRHGKAVPKVSKMCLEQLLRYPWPGNVRELQNYSERAVILSDGDRELEFSDFLLSPPPEVKSMELPMPASDKFPTVSEMEQNLILKALERSGGNRNEASKMLGINVRTLRNKLHQYAEEGTLPAIAGSDDDSDD